MAIYEQGEAPAVLFEGDKVVWAFREQRLALKDAFAYRNNNELHNRLIAAGAICVKYFEEEQK